VTQTHPHTSNNHILDSSRKSTYKLQIDRAVIRGKRLASLFIVNSGRPYGYIALPTKTAIKLVRWLVDYTDECLYSSDAFFLSHSQDAVISFKPHSSTVRLSIMYIQPNNEAKEVGHFSLKDEDVPELIRLIIKAIAYGRRVS